MARLLLTRRKEAQLSQIRQYIIIILPGNQSAIVEGAGSAANTTSWSSELGTDDPASESDNPFSDLQKPAQVRGFIINFFLLLSRKPLTSFVFH
jgi:hypothetical protein